MNFCSILSITISTFWILCFDCKFLWHEKYFSSTKMYSSAFLTASSASKLSSLKCASKFVVTVLRYLDFLSMLWNFLLRKVSKLFSRICVGYPPLQFPMFEFYVLIASLFGMKNIFSARKCLLLRTWGIQMHLNYHVWNARVNLLSGFWNIWICVRAFEMFSSESWFIGFFSIFRIVSCITISML